MLRFLYPALLTASIAAAQFTADQAAAGRQAYQQSCAACHLATLAGQGEAPQLAGPAFIKVWGTRSTLIYKGPCRLGIPPADFPKRRTRA